MRRYSLVAVGGGLGSLLRFAIGESLAPVTPWSPLATFIAENSRPPKQRHSDWCLEQYSQTAGRLAQAPGKERLSAADPAALQDRSGGSPQIAAGFENNQSVAFSRFPARPSPPT